MEEKLVEAFKSQPNFVGGVVIAIGNKELNGEMGSEFTCFAVSGPNCHAGVIELLKVRVEGMLLKMAEDGRKAMIDPLAN